MYVSVCLCTRTSGELSHIVIADDVVNAIILEIQREDEAETKKAEATSGDI
jgi:hypothetical protein